METVIARLLQEFENGRMNRRQLIKSLVLAAPAAAAARAAAQSPSSADGFRTIGLDHISYEVSDYGRTRDFYAELMGMAVSDDNGKSQCFLHFGDSLLIARNHRQRPNQTPRSGSGPQVDHIAYKIADWDTDAVKAELESRGLTPRLDAIPEQNYASFHVKDPDGYDLQISGDIEPGDSLYKR
ncbi:MAG: VOC family protein [Gemmatimonadales bacterium]